MHTMQKAKQKSSPDILTAEQSRVMLLCFDPITTKCSVKVKV